MKPSPTGVTGLDATLCGGFPTGRTVIVAGGPGSGKTVLALQFLIAGASLYGEPGLLISFEESPAALQRNWQGMSSSLNDVLGKSVHILDGRVPGEAFETGASDLNGMIAVLSSRVQKFGIKRIAIDGIDALFSLGANEANRRREIWRVLSWLGDSGITTLLTMKADDDTDGIPATFSFADFAADGVLQLRSTVIEHLLRRTLRVVKLRGSGFLAGDHPYTISTRGLTVLTSPMHAKITKTESLTTRLSTGIERLDRMLDGGYRAGTVTLLTGLPGTSKTTLCAEFLWAGCLAGERVLYVGFDEPAEQMIFDCKSLGIDLQAFAASDLLHAVSFTAGSAIGDDHFLAIEALLDKHRPTRVVIDPVSALAKSGGAEVADAVTERLALLFKSRGITAVLTAVSNTSHGESESSTTRVSTVADTWIHLSFAAHRGERNRTLTVIKSRGTAHSNQLRELVLSHAGVTLADVYLGGGDVLFGTARLRREQEAAAERVQAEQHSQSELLSLEEERDAVTRSLEDLKRRLGQIDSHRLSIEKRTAVHGNVTLSNAAAVREARFGDPRGAETAEPD